MAAWRALRSRLADVEDQLTLSWAELDALVGGLPPSAYDHRAFWAGDRPMWKGFRTTDLRMNHPSSDDGLPSARGRDVVRLEILC
jgi:hypothetical protein